MPFQVLCGALTPCEAASQTSLQTQIQDLLNSQNTSSSEVEALKRRVEDTDREKRDLVAVVSRLKQDGMQKDGSCHHILLSDFSSHI